MAEQSAQNGSVFVSYSRKDKEFVRKLNEGLVKNNVKVWVDWEGIPLSADWMAEITSAVESSDSFIVVISPDWLASKVCADELELGLKNNKKLVPILHRDPLKGTSMHEKLAATNWVYMREQDDFDATLPKLVDAIATDLDWVKAHTRLLQRANEWSHKNKNSSYLLRGTDLQEGEKWMSESTQDARRQPLPIQAEYISASRAESLRRQRMTLIGVSLAFVLSIFLAIFALFQRQAAVANEKLAKTSEADAQRSAETAVANEKIAATQRAIAVTAQVEAEQNEILAKAERNAAQSQLYQSKAAGLNTSTLLAIDSWNTSNSVQAEEILRQNLSIMAVPAATLWQSGSIRAINFNIENTAFASASEDGSACVWDAVTYAQKFCVEHAQPVVDALFTQDGKWLVTASTDGTAVLWDATNGSQVRVIELGSPATDLDVSMNGRWLAIAREDNSFSAIDFTDPRDKVYNVVVSAPATVIKFSPDSRWMGIGTKSGKLHFWYTGSNFTTAGAGHTEEVFSLAFSPDSQYMVSAGADSRARVSKTTSGREVWSLLHGDWTEDVSFSPNGTWFTVASDDNRVWIWNIDTGLSKPRLHHSDMVQKVSYSSNGEWIASTGYDQTLRIWDATGGTEMVRAVLKGVGLALAFSADNSQVVVGTNAGQVSVWKLPMLDYREAYIEFPELIHQPVFSSDGSALFINTDDRKVWKIDSAEILQTADGTNAEPLFTNQALSDSMAVSADGNWLAVALESQGVVALYNLPGKQLSNIEVGNAITDVTFTPDSKMLAIGGEDGQVYVWGVEEGALLFTLPHGASVLGVTISPDGKTLIAGTASRTPTTAWDLSTRQAVAELPQVGSVGHVLFSDDGQWLATGDDQGTVKVWDARNLDTGGQPVYTLAHNDSVLALAFSPDHRWLAVGSEDKFVHVWDMSTGGEIIRIPHVASVLGVTFTPDGRYMLTNSLKLVRIWDTTKFMLVPTPELIETACLRLTENMNQTEWETVYHQEPYRNICPDLPQGQE